MIEAHAPVTSTADQPILRADRISKAFPGVQALSEVSLKLYPGEIHALAGENGSGKSTLAKTLYGAVRPDSGTIEVDGVAQAFTSPRQALERGIVAISQELTLAPTLSVAENVLMGRLPRTRIGSVDWVAARRFARAALDRLGVNVDPRALVGGLSVELQQEIEIARAITADSRILVLDEATSSLSEAGASKLLVKLEQLRREGVAILFISHRIRELYECASKATVLRDGLLIGEYRLPATSEANLVKNMVGRPIGGFDRTASPRSDGAVLSLRHLTTADRTVRGASFEVRAGEIVGVAGLVGSGKAELGLALAGALPWHGKALVAGRPAKLRTPREARSAGIAFIPDDRKRNALFPTRSVQQNLSIAWLPKLARGGVINPWAEQRMAREVTGSVAVRTRSLASRISELSGGNQQKVVLGRWFALDLPVLVLSEPTRGIDIGAKEEIYRFIQEIAADGKGILLISSELPELLRMADRILAIYQGRICGEFDARSVTEEELAHVVLTGSGRTAA